MDALRKLCKLRQQEINILLAEAEAREECDKEDSEDESDAEKQITVTNYLLSMMPWRDVMILMQMIAIMRFVITPTADKNKLAGEDNSNSDTITGHDC